ncbi:MAG: peptidoglycan editing factor PgeF [Hyphomicrobiaceae bacterium]
MINGAVLEAEALSGIDGVRHGFFTRQGGVSAGDYDSLNVGLGSEDKRDDVIENRRRVAAHLGAQVDGQAFPDIVTNYQVHSADAVIVEAPFGPDGPPKADALVTNRPGLAIGALTADCTPVLFADDVAKVVAAAHAGWRGAVSGVLAGAVVAMEELGASRSRIRAVIGPTIHQDAYEVGPEFKAQFLAQAPGNAQFFMIPPGRARDHFDLPGYCAQALQQLGLAHVEDLGHCTYADESLFFSYRRKTHRNEGDYGRQIAAIVVT